MTTLAIDPVEALVQASKQFTAEVAKTIETNAGKGDMVAIFEQKELLMLFETFSLLDERRLGDTQQVVIQHPGLGVSVETDMPLYGDFILNSVTGGWKTLPFTRMNDTYVRCHNMTSASARKQYVMALKRLEFKAFLEWDLITYDSDHDVYLEEGKWKNLFYLVTNPIQIPEEVHEIAKQAKELGFSELHIVWAPLSFGFEEDVVYPDPLLVGTKLGRRWILHRWGETPEEKKLIVPD